jgi:hypothetical protein
MAIQAFEFGLVFKLSLVAIASQGFRKIGKLL